MVGYAYSSSYRPRPAYARTREVSVYLDASARGRGVGRALYDDLLGRLRADGVHQVLAVIALPNDASEALHRACGFERVGRAARGRLEVRPLDRHRAVGADALADAIGPPSAARKPSRSATASRRSRTPA